MMMLGGDKHNDVCEGEIYGRREEMGQVLITATGVSLNSTQTLGCFTVQASNSVATLNKTSTILARV